MIVLGGGNTTNERAGYVAMTLSPTGTTAMDTSAISISPSMTVANGVPKVGATVSVPAGTLSSGVSKSSSQVDRSDLVETKSVTANGTYSASDKLWNQIIVNVPDSGSDVSIQSSKTATLSTANDVTITPDPGYDVMATVVVPKVQLEERSVTLSSSQTLTPAGSNLGFSKVTVNVNSGGTIKNQTKSADMPTSGVSLTVYPDPGYTGLDSVTISALNLQSKSVDPSTSVQTVKADDGYHGLSQVTVTATSSGGATANIQSTKTIDNSTFGQAVLNSTSNVVTFSKDDAYDAMGNISINVSNIAWFNGTGYTSASAPAIRDGFTYYLFNPTTHRITQVTGSMTDNGAVSKTFTSPVESYTIPAGYHNGNGTVSVNLSINAYYVGATAPSASLGNDGDIYLKT